MRVVVRTNLGKGIGFGHFFRCLSIVTALKKISQVEDIFVLNEETQFIDKQKIVISENFDHNDISTIKSLNPDVVIFDSYQANSDYLKELSMIASLVVFDDNNDVYDRIYADILINGNLYATSLSYKSVKANTIKLLGPKYLVMKPEYWYIEDGKRQSLQGEGILVTTGGSDFFKLMPMFVMGLKNLHIKKKIVIGPGYEEDEIKEIETLVDDSFEIIYKPGNLKPYIENTKIVLTTASTTVYEVLTLRKVPIVYVAADNQIKLERVLKSYGVKSLGWHRQIKWENLESEVREVFDRFIYYQETLKKLYDKFDGKGALRVAKIILKELV